MISPENRQEHIRKIELGDRARAFLQSADWLDIVKPIIDSMIGGVVDVRNMKSADISSEIKAQVEVKARKMVAEYIEEIETLINGFVIDGDVSKKILEREMESSELFKTRD